MKRDRSRPILITGGCGFIGSNIADRLAAILAEAEAINAIKTRTTQAVLKVTFTRFNIALMIEKIQGLLKIKGRVSIFEVADTQQRMELIGAFLAILELSKRSLARIIQSKLFAMIYITGR